MGALRPSNNGFHLHLSTARNNKGAPQGGPFLFRGGERGIRTLEGLLTLTPLAGERFRPLSHLSELRALKFFRTPN